MVLPRNPTELKDAINKVRSELTRQGIDSAPLLDPVLDANRDFGGKEGIKSLTAILRSPEVLLSLPVDSAVKPIVKVGDGFDLRTLLSISDTLRTFYIVALSQKRTRILECTRRRVTELPFPEGFAASLADAMQTRPPDHVLDNRSTGGPSTGSMKGVMFGTSTDRESKDEYMLHFFMEIDRAVNVALRGRQEPLMAAGVESELALYRRVNTYPRLLEPGVQAAPDGMDTRELQRRAVDLLDSRPEQTISESLAGFDKKIGTGHASVHIQEIISGAYEGRVFQLFFQEGAIYSGTFDPVRQRVKHTEDPLDNPIDLIEEAARQTIAHGGEAHILPASAMPNGVPVCALFRYPATPGTSG